MYPIDIARVSSLVRLVTEQVVARFFHTLSILTEKEQHEFTEAVDWLTNRITEEIVHTGTMSPPRTKPSTRWRICTTPPAPS